MFPTLRYLPPRLSVWLVWELEMKVIAAIFWSLKSLWGRLIKLFVDCKLYLWHLADNDKYLPSHSKPTHSSLPPQAGTNINQGQDDKC